MGPLLAEGRKEQTAHPLASGGHRKEEEGRGGGAAYIYYIHHMHACGALCALVGRQGEGEAAAAAAAKQQPSSRKSTQEEKPMHECVHATHWEDFISVSFNLLTLTSCKKRTLSPHFARNAGIIGAF